MQINALQILFQLLNFGVVVGVLSFLLFNPIKKILEERAKKIEDGQKAAQEAIDQKAALDQTLAENRKKADKDMLVLMEEAKEKAEAARKKLLESYKEELEQERAEFQKSWEEEKKQFIQEMRQSFATAVSAAASKVLGQKVDEKADNKLIAQELENLVKSI